VAAPQGQHFAASADHGATFAPAFARVRQLVTHTSVRPRESSAVVELRRGGRTRRRRSVWYRPGGLMLSAYLFDQRQGESVAAWADKVQQLEGSQVLWLDLLDISDGGRTSRRSPTIGQCRPKGSGPDPSPRARARDTRRSCSPGSRARTPPGTHRGSRHRPSRDLSALEGRPRPPPQAARPAAARSTGADWPAQPDQAMDPGEARRIGSRRDFNSAASASSLTSCVAGAPALGRGGLEGEVRLATQQTHEMIQSSWSRQQ
jgi:hypothetical protein